jgi:hypothetical protein
MTPEEARRAALEQMLSNAGAGRVAADPAMWQRVVRPALEAPVGDRASTVRQLWANRNAAVATARNNQFAGTNAALDALREQRKQEARRGMGRVRRSGGMSTGSTVPTSPVDPMQALFGDFFQYLEENSPRPLAPPSYGQRPVVDNRRHKRSEGDY